jgi:hypothetical protein
VILKIVPKASHECTLEISNNQTIRARESRNRNLMLLSEQFIELVSVFTEASKSFILILLLN